MISVLIIDDNNERIRKIAASINGDDINVEHVMTKNEALCRLEETKYDLVIIDIMLPENIDSVNPQPTAGIDIIKDIYQRAKIIPPRSIIGVTSSNETFEHSKRFFEEKLVPILIWNESDDLWKKQLEEKIKYLKLNESAKLSVDIAIVTAVDEEFDSVKQSYEKWQRYNIENDPAMYFITEIQTEKGHSKKILLTKLCDMGMPAASNAVTKIILNFNPKSIYMVGICGGVRNEVKLCDVIVATQTWDYGSGKIKPRVGDEKLYYKFEPSPKQINSKPEIITNLTYFGEDVLQTVVNNWNNVHRDKHLTSNLKFCPMPSGASVICDPFLFEEIIKPQHRKCKGFDMETFGVYYAIQYTSIRPIDFISIKSVSDFADTEKDDNYHEACCYLSSNFLNKCIYKEIL